MKTAHEVLADWANNARAPLASVTCDGIATGIETWLREAGYAIVPVKASEAMVNEMARIAEGPLISEEEFWGYVLAAAIANPEPATDQ